MSLRPVTPSSYMPAHNRNVLQCRLCGTQHTIPGTLQGGGTWHCQACFDAWMTEAEKLKDILREAAKTRYRLNPGMQLVVAKVLPANASDDDIAAAMRECYGVRVTREANGVIVWCEA